MLFSIVVKSMNHQTRTTSRTNTFPSLLMIRDSGIYIYIYIYHIVSHTGKIKPSNNQPSAIEGYSEQARPCHSEA